MIISDALEEYGGGKEAGKESWREFPLDVPLSLILGHFQVISKSFLGHV